MGLIVVGVDGSDHGANALRWAVDEANLRGWRVKAVMAWSPTAPIHLRPPEFEALHGTAWARAVLSALVERVAGDAGVEIDEAVICDPPAVALLQASADAELLVLGARGLGGVKALMMGSVSQACLHRSLTPLVIVRDLPDRSPDVTSRIVVGVDGSAESGRALGWAVDEAGRRRSELEVVCALQVPIGELTPWVGPGEYGTVERDGRALIKSMLARVDTTSLDHEVRERIVPGRAIAALLDAAVDADLVVVGGRAVGGFAGMVLGSVSHALVHRAPCPVVVLPEWATPSAAPSRGSASSIVGDQPLLT